MPRKAGSFGQYGSRDTGSKLAKRRQLEALNPGHFVCRTCDLLLPISDSCPYQKSSCLTCVRLKATARYRESHPQPQKRSSASCAVCDDEFTPPHNVTPGDLAWRWCRHCRLNWNQKRHKRRLHIPLPRRKPPTKAIGTYLCTLNDAVRRVFYKIGVTECKKHGWQDLSRDGTKTKRCILCKKARSRNKLLRMKQSEAGRVKLRAAHKRNRQNRNARAKVDPTLRRTLRLKAAKQRYLDKGLSVSDAVVMAELSVTLWDIQEAAHGSPIFTGGNTRYAHRKDI